MPQPHERKTQNGITGEWNGHTWIQVDGGGSTPASDPSAVAGYHPSLADSESPWLSRLKGFFSGASEAATPGKIGTAAALATALPSGGLSLPVAAAIAGGGTGAADLLQSFFHTANAPQSGNQFLGDVAGATAIPVTGALVGKGASMLGDAVGHRGVGTGLGAVTGGYEGYQHGGIPGAVVGAVTGGAAGAFGQTKLQKLGKLFGLGEEAAAAAPVAEEGGFAPGASRGRSTAQQVHYGGPEGDIPDYSTRSPAYEPQPVDPKPPSVDRYMPNASAENQEPGNSQINFPVGQRAVAQPFGSGGPMRVQQPMGDQAFTDSLVDKYAPNISGYSGQDVPSTDRVIGPPEPTTDRYTPNASGYEPIDSSGLETPGWTIKPHQLPDMAPMPPSLSALSDAPTADAASTPYAGPDRRVDSSMRSYLDSLLQDNPDSPALNAIRSRMDGTAKFDPISGQTLPIEDMPKGVNLDAARSTTNAVPPSLQALSGQPSPGQPSPDDVQMVRDLLNTGYSREAALKIGAGSDRSLIDPLSQGLDRNDFILQDPNWDSGAESGSQDAAWATRLHRNQGGNDARLRYLWERDQ